MSLTTLAQVPMNPTPRTPVSGFSRKVIWDRDLRAYNSFWIPVTMSTTPAVVSIDSAGSNFQLLSNGNLSVSKGLGTGFWQYVPSTVLASTYQPILSGTGIVKSISGTISYLVDNSSDWNTAYGWGNHAGLYPLYNGTGATGTWGINITGSAATLATTRNIFGRPFNGSGDVTGSATVTAVTSSGNYVSSSSATNSVSSTSTGTATNANMIVLNDASSFLQMVSYGSAAVGSDLGLVRAGNQMLLHGGTGNLGIGSRNAVDMVLATTNTERLRITSAGALTLASATASTIASFDASKNLVSLPVATYPSLTELTYVKGVTSAIQTQINTNSTAIGTKQPQLNGTGFVKATGTTISYDNNTYATQAYADAKVANDMTTSTNVAPSKAAVIAVDATKQNLVTLTTTGSGAATFNQGTGALNIPTPSASGTVTTVSVTSANGVSGSVANATTTPAITLTLGNITPSNVTTAGTVDANVLVAVGGFLNTTANNSGIFAGTTGALVQRNIADTNPSLTVANVLGTGDIAQFLQGASVVAKIPLNGTPVATTDLIRKQDLDAAVSSGTWIPTVANLANTSSLSYIYATYSKIGVICTVDAIVQFNVTTLASNSDVSITVPFGTLVADKVTGIAINEGVSTGAGSVRYYDATHVNLHINSSPTSGTEKYHVRFTYTIN